MELGFVSEYVSMFVICVRFTNREHMRSHNSWDNTDKSIASQKLELKDVETLFADQSPWLNPRITWWGASSIESSWDGRVWTSLWRGDGSTRLETLWPIKNHQHSYQLVAYTKKVLLKSLESFHLFHISAEANGQRLWPTFCSQLTRGSAMAWQCPFLILELPRSSIPMVCFCLSSVPSLKALPRHSEAFWFVKSFSALSRKI